MMIDISQNKTKHFFFYIGRHEMRGSRATANDLFSYIAKSVPRILEMVRRVTGVLDIELLWGKVWQRRGGWQPRRATINFASILDSVLRIDKTRLWAWSYDAVLCQVAESLTNCTYRYLMFVAFLSSKETSPCLTLPTTYGNTVILIYSCI